MGKGIERGIRGGMQEKAVLGLADPDRPGQGSAPSVNMKKVAIAEKFETFHIRDIRRREPKRPAVTGELSLIQKPKFMVREVQRFQIV